MSTTLPGFEVEPKEAFIHYLEDLIQNPPYSDIDMVYLLTDGSFQLLGRKSDITDAEIFVASHNNEHTKKALELCQREQVELATNTSIY